MSAPITPAAPALDYAALDDELLVVMVQEVDSWPAQRELVCRYLALAHKLIGRYAARGGLQEADRQDVQQEAVLWVVEAIRHYDLGQYDRPGGCHFRSFVHRVIGARLIDALRRLRHQRRHFHSLRALPADLGKPPAARNGDAAADETGGAGTGPVWRAEAKELWSRLHEGVCRLGEPDRRLWDLLAAGATLRAAAAQLNISYDAAKRRRRKVLAGLKSFLANEERPHRPKLG